uniref:Uncharacterized protein n=1 Tax=Megaselia scalaris TaxID=36166 RepID=T1GEA3_MEGSC
MHALIYIEEVQETYEMEAYNMNRVFLKRILECDCYFLEIENLVDRRPSLTIGGMVLASDRKFTKKGAIVDVEDNGVLLKFPPSFSQEYRNQIFSMRFLCSRFNFRKQHYSVEEAHRRLGTNVLFPTMPVMNETIQCDAQLNRDLKICVSLENGEQVLVDWFNSRLDEFQKIAIKNILRGECRPMPYVIFGPPGAGKTFTIVEAALQIVKCVTDCRILIGTTSNSAADLLSELLIDSGFLSSSDFVRVISHNYLERDLIPDRIKPYCATISLGAKLMLKTRDSKGLLRAFFEMMQFCTNPMFVTNTGMKLHCQIQHLKPFKIIISTCSTLGNFHQLNFDAGHFTHVLIDEAGQCTEPECLIPISMVNKDIGQIILVGDPMQLGPNVHCKIAMSRGLETHI